MYKTNDYDYYLPKELIAQKPIPTRGKSRLLLLKRNTGKIQHHFFNEFINFLKPNDVLVINDTKTIPSRLLGSKKTGGKIEVLISNLGSNFNSLSNKPIILTCLLQSSRKSKIGTKILFKKGLEGLILSYKKNLYEIEFSNGFLLKTVISNFGKIPLPNYIKRKNMIPNKEDYIRYQTVYGNKPGAIATPTAGLHFTNNMIEKIKKIGIKIVSITLHVGYGTFIPVTVQDLRDHKMHSELISIDEKTAKIINEAKIKENRIIAIGTTTVRSLEGAATNKKRIVTKKNESCDLFIYPGYNFKIIDAILTNFHFPKSTLLMLISAFCNKENILKAYQSAIEEKYSFFSYGDAMFIY